MRIYGIRHWIEQSYKQAGWALFQVRSDTAIRRHQTLVTCAFSFCWDTWFAGGFNRSSQHLVLEVLMGRPAGWMAALTWQSPMKSPGAPALRREVERQFWREIAKGLLAEEAAAAVGVSQAAGGRWFRHGGGMPPMDLVP